MSKAVRISFTERIYNDLKEIISKCYNSSISASKMVSDFPEISFSSIDFSPVEISCPEIPVALTETNDVFYPDNAVSQTMLPEPSYTNENMHVDVVNILESIGYKLKDVKALPSGEKKITIDELLGNFQEEKEFEYIYRS